MEKMLIEKSRSLSAVLAFFFGPLGLLYANWKIALIPILMFLVAPIYKNAGYNLEWLGAIIWIGCIFLGDYFIRHHNKLVCDKIEREKNPVSYNNG